MTMAENELAPDEIRSIRERLGLTQAEAGELIGGGPRAFTKYETGTVKPSAAVINLLRLLEANPEARSALIAPSPLPSATRALGPFEVSADHIAVLTEHELPELLGRLLRAEADAHDLPDACVRVPKNIHAPDGGEDGHISWEGGADHTTFLPGRLSQFQLKAGRITPAAAGKEVLTAGGDVKEMVRSALEAGGHYFMLCTDRYTRPQRGIEARERQIRDALKGAGLPVPEEVIHFRDASQIADWANHHPAVAAWVKERTDPSTVSFRSWSHWAGRQEHEQSPWVEDERLPALRETLMECAVEPRSAVRVTGLPGVGKSRLALEALGPDRESGARLLSDFVVYASMSETAGGEIARAVQSLADQRRRAIVVVDGCDSRTHETLSRMVARAGSGASLITIDDVPSDDARSPETITVSEAPDSVVEAMIGHLRPGLPREDHRRLVRFSRGHPGIAVRVLQAWNASVPLARAVDRDLIKDFVLGRRTDDDGTTMMAARLLATFGMVAVRPPKGAPRSAEEHEALIAFAQLFDAELPENVTLAEIAALGSQLSEKDFYAECVDLAERGVAQRRGETVLLPPGPIAMNLAERQWRAWQETEWDSVLSGDRVGHDLAEHAARRLSMLNTIDIAEEVVESVCRPGGPFDGLEAAREGLRSQVLEQLADIAPSIVADQIDRILDDAGDLRRIDGDLRRHIVRALERIAFRPETFEDGARLLLRLAAAETEDWTNNATGVFADLFPAFLGDTAADGVARIRLLDSIARSEDPHQRAVVAKALSSGSRTRDFHRAVGSESQGTLPEFQPWRPHTQAEMHTYVEKCAERLGTLASADDTVSKVAQAELANRLAGLVLEGLIDVVEQAVMQVAAAGHYWPEARSRLSHLLAYNADQLDETTLSRIRALVTELRPKSLDARLQSIVTSPDWGFDADDSIEERQRRMVKAARALAAELMNQPDVLESVLPQLSSRTQQMAHDFGAELTGRDGAGSYWLERLVAALEQVPADDRNFGMLAGYVGRLAQAHPDRAGEFKRRAAESVTLAPSLPEVCIASGVTASDIALMVAAFQVGLLPPRRLTALSFALDGLNPHDVAPLFDALLCEEAWEVALELMGTYTFRDPQWFDWLRPQLVRLADGVARWPVSLGLPMRDHHIEQLMEWMLARGRGDRDACAVALALARGVVEADTIDGAERVRPLLPTLLSDFPEVVWPLFGQAIVSDRWKGQRLGLALGDSYSFGPRKNPLLLDLPEATLFAWCHAHPEAAPGFAAGILPVLASPDGGVDAESRIHPWTARLLDEFGDREDVRDAIDRNVNTFGWSGSATTYYALYEDPFTELTRHPRPEVGRWAKSMLRRLRASREQARNEDEEREARWEV